MHENLNRGSRLVLQHDSDQESNVKLGLAWLVARLKESPGDGMIVVPTLRQITSSVFADVIGSATAKYAEKHRQLKLGSRTIAVQPGTRMSLPHNLTAALVLWDREKAIQEIDRWRPEADVLVVPWIESDVTDLTEHLPFRVLGESPRASNPKSSVVEAALRSLTRRVNVSSGLAHPLDEAAFVDLLYLLRDAGEVIDPAHVQKTLVELGWDIQDARDASKRAERFAGGARLRRPKSPSWPAGAIDQWRSEAEQA